MSCVRRDIVSRSASVDVRKIDKGIKNPWRWEWLEKKVDDINLNECFRKLSKCGACYCVVCGKELMYGSKGYLALVRHVKSTTHMSVLQSRKKNFALPGASDCRKEEISPYGLHPMYAVCSPVAEVNVPQPSVPVVDRVANNEAMLLSFLAENSLPFSIAPDLIELTKQLSKDRKALDHMTMHRTTAAYKLRFGVAKTFKEDVICHLKSTYFSLNADETTSNNHQKVVTLLVNYLGEEKKIVTKHLESFSVNSANSKSIFEGIQDVFQSNNIPWENLMSILLDSCNVMRGKKAGVETRMRAHCPHLLDIDGDSCHHAHNAAKAFCKPFSRYLENLIRDIHNDLKWSPDLRAILSLICDILNIKYTMPENFISFRWLSIYNASQDLFRLFNALVLFYFSFLSSAMKTDFLHIIVKIFKQHDVGEEGRNKIRNLQASVQKKLLTEAGKERKDRISSKLIVNHLQTKLNLCFFISVLPLLQEYIKFFQTSSPLIHLLYDKQMKLLREFMACFIKPEVLLEIGNSAKKLKQLNVEDPKYHLSTKCIFIGDSAKKIISLAPKTCTDVVKTFHNNTLKAYIAGTKALQCKMPITNRFLKAVSSIDPRCRQHSLSLGLMKELPNHVKNVISCHERELYELEVQRYQVDSLQPNDEDVDAWWVEIKKTGKYPLLSKMALALLTCFHGPKVESSFSIMNSVITPESSRMNVPTFSAVQSIKYELSARKKTSVAFFKKENYLKDPVDKNLCRNIRSAYKSYSEEKLQNRISKEARKKKLETKKQNILSKIAAKKLCAKAAKKQRKRHINSKSNLKRKINSPQNQSTLQKQDYTPKAAKVATVKEKSSSQNLSTFQTREQGDSSLRQEVTAVKVVETPIVKQVAQNMKCGPPPSKKRKTSKGMNNLTIKEMFAKASIKNAVQK